MRLITYLILGLFAITSTGCATIIGGGHQEIETTSTPSGARVLVDGDDMGTTPLTLNLKRDASHVVTFQLQGYDDIVVNMDKEFRAGAVLAGNLFSWGLLGMVIDVGSGAAYKLTPEELEATLDKNGMSTSAVEINEQSIQVLFFTADQLPEGVTPQGAGR